MDEMEFPGERIEEPFQKRFGEWIECAKCRSLMFDTFVKCWSCGVDLNEKTKVSVRL